MPASSGLPAFSASRSHLYFLATWNSPTWLLASSKPARERDSSKIGTVILCNIIMQSHTHNHIHPITFTLLCLLETSQILPSHKRRGSHQDVNTRRWGWWRPAQQSVWNNTVIKHGDWVIAYVQQIFVGSI